MITKTGISILLSTIVMALSSNVALAVDKTGSSSSIAAWPLILLVVLIIIFRKKIFAEATPEPDHQEEAGAPEPAKPAAAAKQETVKQEAVKQETAKPKQAKKAAPAKKPASKAKPSAKVSSDPIDLTDDGKQCQASTTKGTRCKRTSTLENTTATVDGKTYKLTVCSQHNNDKLKVFSELLK
jgi:hypothetical protein